MVFQVAASHIWHPQKFRPPPIVQIFYDPTLNEDAIYGLHLFLIALLFLGPEFWGLVNWEWKVCSKGQHQSPVNIDPKMLLFDPQLKSLYVDKVRVGKEGCLLAVFKLIAFR